jgi:hypothetical protein
LSNSTIPLKNTGILSEFQAREREGDKVRKLPICPLRHNNMRGTIRSTFVVCLLLAGAASGLAQIAPGRYALVLSDPPVGARYSSRERVRSAEAQGYRSQIQARQRDLRTRLRSGGFRISGSASTVLNAVFVATTPERLNELKALPGVAAVVPMRRGKPALNKATALVNAPAAWNTRQIGGQLNGGKGVKIAILDT